MTVICLDDYNLHDREGFKKAYPEHGKTQSHPDEFLFEKMAEQIGLLKAGKSIQKPIYNHDTGKFDPPELIEPNHIMVWEGLHPITNRAFHEKQDFVVYVDVAPQVKFDWKVRRDMKERGWTEQ